MITREQLQAFCSQDETRAVLAEPWTHDGYTYATDGRMVVRVLALPGCQSGEDWPNGYPQAPWGLMATCPQSTDWQPMPPIPPAPDAVCSQCHAEAAAVCPACKGDGEVKWTFDFCGTEHTRMDECPVCDGEERICNRCWGDGREPDLARVQVGRLVFQARYLRPFTQFTNLEIALCGEREPARVRFDGGDGLVMPCYGSVS